MKLMPLSALMLAASCTSWATAVPFREFGMGVPIDVNGIHVHGMVFGFFPDRAYFSQANGTGAKTLLSTDPIREGPPTAFDPPTSLLPIDMVQQIVLTTCDSRGAPRQPNGFSCEAKLVYSGEPFDPVIKVRAVVEQGGTSVDTVGPHLPFAVQEPSFFALGSGLLAVSWIKHPRSRRRTQRGRIAIH